MIIDMRYILCILLFAFNLSAQVNVTWNWADFTQTPGGIYTTKITPLFQYTASGTNVITGQSRSFTTYNGSVTVSNILNGYGYKVIYGDWSQSPPLIFACITNSFATNVAGNVNGSNPNYLTVITNQLPFLVAGTNILFTSTSGGGLQINSIASGGGSGANLVAGTNISFTTNAGAITINSPTNFADLAGSALTAQSNALATATNSFDPIGAAAAGTNAVNASVTALQNRAVTNTQAQVILQNINDTTGVASVSPQNRALYDSNGIITALDFNSRNLVNASGAPVLNWTGSKPIADGSGLTNITASQAGAIPASLGTNYFATLGLPVPYAWYKASSYAGSTNGAPLSAIKDLAGTHPLAGNGVIYLQGGGNALPAFYFPGGSCVMSNQNFWPSSATNAAVFLVYHDFNQGTYNEELVSAVTNGNETFVVLPNNFSKGSSVNNGVDYLYAGDSYEGGQPIMGHNTDVVFGFVSQLAQNNSYVNGMQGYPAYYQTQPTQIGGDLFVGGKYNNTLHLNGYIYEIMVYVTAAPLTLDQINGINSYLCGQYLPPKGNVYLIGDSNTSGAGALANSNLTQCLYGILGGNWNIETPQGYGYTSANNLSMLRTNIFPLLNASAAPNIFRLMGVGNDYNLTTAETNFILECNLIHSNNCLAYVCTYPSYATETNAGSITWAFNAWLTNNWQGFADALNNQTVNTNWGVAGAFTNNPSYFDTPPDNEHLSGQAYVQMATNDAAIIVSLAQRGSGPPTGNGSGLTNLPATQLTGTVPYSALPLYSITNSSSVNVTNLSGFTAQGSATFTGNGANLTNIPANALPPSVVQTNQYRTQRFYWGYNGAQQTFSASTNYWPIISTSTSTANNFGNFLNFGIPNGIYTNLMMIYQGQNLGSGTNLQAGFTLNGINQLSCIANMQGANYNAQWTNSNTGTVVNNSAGTNFMGIWIVASPATTINARVSGSYDVLIPIAQ